MGPTGWSCTTRSGSRGGAAEAAAGQLSARRIDQRLGCFAQRKRGAELRRGGEVDGVSYALLSDSKAGGGYGGASRRSSRGNPRESELLKARRVVCSKSRAITAQT
jgi:hypothetical protein